MLPSCPIGAAGSASRGLPPARSRRVAARSSAPSKATASFSPAGHGSIWRGRLRSSLSLDRKEERRIIVQAQFKMLAAYNEWVNRRLYGAAALIPEGDYRADRGAFFGSL